MHTKYVERDMPRCKKHRRCRRLSNEKIYKPLGIPAMDLEDVNIALDEFEAMRLCDHEDNNQIEASEKMEVSRATIQRLLQSGRKKILDALLHNKAIVIASQLDLNNKTNGKAQEE